MKTASLAARKKRSERSGAFERGCHEDGLDGEVHILFTWRMVIQKMDGG